MNCCQCQGIEELFTEKYVTKELSSYRAKGPDKTTRMLAEAIKQAGVYGLTLLDIGGGVGAVQHELLDAGVQSATDVEASSAYITAARTEAQRRGFAARPASDPLEPAGQFPAGGRRGRGQGGGQRQGISEGGGLPAPEEAPDTVPVAEPVASGATDGPQIAVVVPATARTADEPAAPDELPGDGQPKSRRRRGRRGGRRHRGRGQGSQAQGDSAPGSDAAVANQAADGPASSQAVVRTGSSDRHLVRDEPVIPQPLARPRSLRDLDNIPDDLD